jgi:hypothetical protein
MPVEPNSLSETTWLWLGKSTIPSTGCPQHFFRPVGQYSGLKFFAGLLITIFLFLALVPAREASAGFATGLTLTLGAEYNDNIFFTKKQESDFITFLVPSFTVYYAPPSQTVPTFAASFSPVGQIFARHSDLNSFGENFSFSTGYTYRYSPRLTFHVADSVGRGDATRTVQGLDFGEPSLLPSTATMFPPGGFAPQPIIQATGPLLSTGNNFSNQLFVSGAFLAAPNFTITGGYDTAYRKLDSVGGSELENSIGIRGAYNWFQQNLHAGYSVTFLNSPNVNSKGKRGESVIHNLDVGDDYFSSLKIEFTPTLTLAGRSGIGINTGGNGPRIVSSTNLTLIKIWENAVFNATFDRGLNNIGISGAGLGTGVSTGFSVRLTERLSGNLGAQYGIFDSDVLNLKIFRAGAGLEYWFTSWLFSSLRYSYRWLDNSGKLIVGDKNSLKIGTLKGNDIAMSLSIRFDVWPHIGLARGPARPLYAPLGAPFNAVPEIPQPQQPVTSQPATPQLPGSP